MLNDVKYLETKRYLNVKILRKDILMTRNILV